MISLTELRAILKENKIRGYLHYNKSELADVIVKRGLLPDKYETNKQVKAKKDIAHKYNFLREGYSHRKKVEIHDLETDKVTLYPSIHKVALIWDQNTGVICMYNGKVWRKRYGIKVLTES